MLSYVLPVQETTTTSAIKNVVENYVPVIDIIKRQNGSIATKRNISLSLNLKPITQYSRIYKQKSIKGVNSIKFDSLKPVQQYNQKQNQQKEHYVDAMLANVKSTHMQSIDTNDERTRLLSGSPLSMMHAPIPSCIGNTVGSISTNNNNGTSNYNSFGTNINNNNNNPNNDMSSIDGNVTAVTPNTATIAANNATPTTATTDHAEEISMDTGAIAETIANSDFDASNKHHPISRQSIATTTAAAGTTTTTTAAAAKKLKLSKLGTKSVGLKRVSFGSSKGSMVETLVFETPTPLSEHVETRFGFDNPADIVAVKNSQSPCVFYTAYPKINMDDSGIEVQEESERSIVRVSIYQSNQPQQICPPPEYIARFDENLDNSLNSYNCNLDYLMTSTNAVTMVTSYDRQQSTDSGWDNPFRPGGDLSREADEIVNMIRGGKPITPTEDHIIGNGHPQRSGDNCNGTGTAESVSKTNLTQTQSAAQNGTNSHKVVQSTSGIGGATSTENNGVTSQAQVSKQVVPGPTSASHVVIDEKKNKKKGCCVVQ